MNRSVVLVMALGATACATKPPSPDDDILMAMIAGQAPHAELSPAERAEVERHPLGSEMNPVRVEMPAGERAYLQRLRCPDGKAPTFRREGSAGASPYGSIMDIYSVECASQPARKVYMDMYHRGYIEPNPTEGMSIVGPDGG